MSDYDDIDTPTGIRRLSEAGGDGRMAKVAEAAYRRGFDQGAYSAVERAQRDPHSLDDWREEVTRWRFRGYQENWRFEEPPW